MQQIICLITPPSVFLLDERVFLSLGILKVAACLEEAGHAVEMVDLSGIDGFENAIRDHAASTTTNTFGITATTPQMPAVTKIVSAIRGARADAKIILGGPHITLVCAALKREKKLGFEGRATKAYAKLEQMFDVLVAGDGEDAIFWAIQTDAPKYIDADNPSGPLFMTSDRLNESPWPARHLVDLPSYHYSIDGVPATSAVFQLGCPYGCNFCGGRESPMLRRVRMRSTKNVVGEIEHIYDTYGIRALMAYDDETNVNPKMLELMKALSDMQDRIGVEFKFRGFVKSQLLTDAQAEALYKAGFKWILVGFESGSDRILENINKRATKTENTRCMAIARRHGLKVKALMSIGHAGESEQTIAETKQWLLDVKPDDFDASIISTYPGCPYFDFAVKHPHEPNVWTFTTPKSKDRLHAYEVDYTQTADYYKGQNVGGYKAYVFTDSLSPEKLVELRDDLESDVRARLGIPFNAGAPGIRYEASMGITKLPPNILKVSH